MTNEADSKDKAKKPQEMMDDGNFELDIDALEDAAGGKRVAWVREDGMVFEYDTYDD